MYTYIEYTTKVMAAIITNMYMYNVVALSPHTCTRTHTMYMYIPTQVSIHRYPYTGTHTHRYPYTGTHTHRYPYTGTHTHRYPYTGTHTQVPIHPYKGYHTHTVYMCQSIGDAHKYTPPPPRASPVCSSRPWPPARSDAGRGSSGSPSRCGT